MKKMIVMAGLLAAASAIPAMAQDWRSGREANGIQGQAERGERPDRGERQQRQAQSQPAPQVQAQAQAPRAEFQGRRNFGGQAAAPNVAVQAQAQNRFRDRDNDGIRNRRDVDVNGDGRADFGRRDRDGDGVRNRADRDRDGDGIRNRRDADANGNGRVDARYDRNRDGQIDRRFDRNNNGRIDPRYGNGYGRPGYGNGYNNGYGRPGYSGNWNRDWRNDRRYDWNSYRNYNRGLFSLPRYYAPYGWNYGYRRFSIGITLNSLLFSRNYWIDDPYQYRLPPAYPPYRWVRYYNDALLIDERSGYVVDAQYDFFY